MDIFRLCSIFWSRLKGIWNYFGRKDQRLQEFAIGMSSEVDFKQDLHILILDYDEVSLEKVEESVRELQSFWNLSDAFIYKTRRGYHCYFYYDIMPYSRVVMILNYAKFVDDQFRYISKFYNRKTIRVCGKYKERDIFFEKKLSGLRKPSVLDAELGDMKRKEREILSGHRTMFKKELLKE